MEYTLYKGDCLELFKKIPDSSIDLILCDPPYGIMGGKTVELINLDIAIERAWRKCIGILH